MPETSSLVKAYLSVTASGGPGGGGSGHLSGGTGTLTFKINPKDYSISKSARWQSDSKATSTTSAPEAQYLGPNARSLKLEIFFDESDSVSGDVSRDVDALMDCCNPLPGSSKPPVVVFGWGTHVHFNAYVEQVDARFTMFRADGTPYRATCSLGLKELAAPQKAQNPTSGTRSIERTRTLVAGDTLASISYQEYGKAGYWRAIAKKNSIDDPMKLRTGTSLLIPTPAEAESES